MHSELRRLTEQIVGAITYGGPTDPQDKFTLSNRRFSTPIPKGTRSAYRSPSVKFHGDVIWDPQQPGGSPATDYFLVGTLANLFEEKLKGSEWGLVNGVSIKWPIYQHQKYRLEFSRYGVQYSGLLYLDGELEIS